MKHLFSLLLLSIALTGCVTSIDVEAQNALEELAAREPRLEGDLANTIFGEQIQRAVVEHPAVQAAQARVDAASAGIAAAESGGQIQLSLGVDTSVALAGAATGTTSVVPVVTASRLVFDGDVTAFRIQAARANFIGASVGLEEAAAAIANQAVQAWAQLESTLRLQELAEENLAAHQRLAAQMEDRFNSGVGSQADLLTARSRLTDAEAQSIEIVGQAERAVAIFEEFFGFRPNDLIEVPPAPPLPGGTDAEIIATSPSVRAQDAAVFAGEAVVEASEAASFWPSLTLSLTGSYDIENEQEALSASAQPRYELLNGGARAAATNDAIAQLAERQAQRAQAERDVGRALGFSRTDDRIGLQRIENAQKNLEATQATVAAIEDQFGIGRSSIITLLDAQRDLFDASASLERIRLELALNGYASLELTGDIIDVFDIQLRGFTPYERKGWFARMAERFGFDG